MKLVPSGAAVTSSVYPHSELAARDKEVSPASPPIMCSLLIFVSTKGDPLLGKDWGQKPIRRKREWYKSGAKDDPERLGLGHRSAGTSPTGPRNKLGNHLGT